MTSIKRSALVPFTPHQMFELVNGIEEYPRFLPWCRSSQILVKTPQEIEASLDIAWSGIHKSFVTRNHLSPDERIDIVLVKGPFKHLQGHWHFIACGSQGCKINFELEFELAGNMVDKLFEPIFHHIANSLVEAFCKRAREIYVSLS